MALGAGGAYPQCYMPAFYYLFMPVDISNVNSMDNQTLMACK